MTDKLTVINFTGKTFEPAGKECEEFEKLNVVITGNPPLMGESYSLRLNSCIDMKPGERIHFGVISKHRVCIGDEPSDERSYVKTTIKPDVDVALVPVKRADFVNHAELLNWVEDGKKQELELTPYTFIRFLETALDERNSEFRYAMDDKLSEVEYVKSLLSFSTDDDVLTEDDVRDHDGYPFLGIMRASDRQQKDKVRRGVLFPSASDFIKDGDCRLHLELALSVKHLTAQYGIAGNRAANVILNLSNVYFSGMLNRELHEAFMLHDCIKHMHDHSVMNGNTESFDEFCASLVYTVRSHIYNHLCLPHAARMVCEMMCKINGTAHPAGSSSWRVTVDLGEE